MKRSRFLVVILLLLTIACSSGPSSESQREPDKQVDSLSVAKKKTIKDFWTFYRQATKDRIAGSWQEAVDGYAKALELNNDHEDARYYLANMYLELEDFNKAEENWNKLIALNTASSRAHFQLGKLYLNYEAIEFFDLAKATDKFQRTTDINQDFLQPLLHLAQISIIQGNYSDSLEKLRIVLGSDYKNVEALFLIGFIDYKNGNMEDATANYMKARELSMPQDPVNEIKGEGDTKTGKSLERAINQSIFVEYFENFEPDKRMEIEEEMKLRYSSLNNFIIQLQNM